MCSVMRRQQSAHHRAARLAGSVLTGAVLIGTVSALAAPTAAAHGDHADHGLPGQPDPGGAPPGGEGTRPPQDPWAVLDFEDAPPDTAPATDAGPGDGPGSGPGAGQVQDPAAGPVDGVGATVDAVAALAARAESAVVRAGRMPFAPPWTVPAADPATPPAAHAPAEPRDAEPLSGGASSNAEGGTGDGPSGATAAPKGDRIGDAPSGGTGPEASPRALPAATGADRPAARSGRTGHPTTADPGHDAGLPGAGAPPGPGGAPGSTPALGGPAAAAAADLPAWAGGPGPALAGFVPWPYGQTVAVITGAATGGTPAATGWTRPVDDHHPVSAEYGTPGSWQAGYHTGVDFALPEGEPVRSVGPGTVVVAGDSGDYGETVVVRMEDGHHILYAHLSAVAVAVGDTVRGGQEIGKSGNTGRSTGPHLHFEVREGREYGTDVDPLEYLRSHGVDI